MGQEKVHTMGNTKKKLPESQEDLLGNNDQNTSITTDLKAREMLTMLLPFSTYCELLFALNRKGIPGLVSSNTELVLPKQTLRDSKICRNECRYIC